MTPNTKKISTDVMLAEVNRLPTDPTGLANAAMTMAFRPTTNIDEGRVANVMAEIDLENTNTITRFGASASREATSVSRRMLDGVRNKDTGPVGDVMNTMMTSIRGLDVGSLEGGGFFGWLKSKASRVAGFVQKYETVRSQIDAMQAELETQQTTLMVSVENLDDMYDATEDQFANLEVYIVAGINILGHLNDVLIPEMQAALDADSLLPEDQQDTLLSQKFRDLNNRRDTLERKVSDLKLTRMVTLQNFPKIRMTQDSDNNLIAKIDSMFSTTIPIWESNMAIALEVSKTEAAANAVSNVADATSEMIMAGAKQFETATIKSREAVEKSVVDIDAVRAANESIISAIEASVAIAVEGKKQRDSIATELVGQEAALRTALTVLAQPQAAYGSAKAA